METIINKYKTVQTIEDKGNCLCKKHLIVDDRIIFKKGKEYKYYTECMIGVIFVEYASSQYPEFTLHFSKKNWCKEFTDYFEVETSLKEATEKLLFHKKTIFNNNKSQFTVLDNGKDVLVLDINRKVISLYRDGQVVKEKFRQSSSMTLLVALALDSNERQTLKNQLEKYCRDESIKAYRKECRLKELTSTDSQ